MKKLFRFTLIMSVVMSSMLSFEATAQTFTFEPSDFSVSNNGELPMTYYFVKFDSILGQYYQLTDTVRNNGTLMFYNQQIDLNQNWVLKFFLRFAQGKKDKVYANDPGNGIAMLLTKNKSGAYYSPHHQISTSPVFMIEYDTEWDGFSTEGGGSNTERQHTAFLKNASYAALPGTYAQMQNNWGKVTNNQWICCKIVYKHLPGGGILVENWMGEMKEDDPQFEYLILRNSKVFSSITDLVDDVVISNGQALVWWGFGATNCVPTTHNHNRHDIKYEKLEYGEETLDFDLVFDTIYHPFRLRAIGLSSAGFNFVEADSIVIPCVGVFHPNFP